MIHRFGPFQYDTEQRLLLRDGETIPLLPKVIDTLHALLEHRGRVVGKSELMKLVWPDTAVEEVGLARNISILRKALCDESGESTYIETIPRRGYRFAAEETKTPKVARAHRKWALLVVGLAAAAAFVWWQFYTPSHFRPGAVTLAVVPFDCVTPGVEACGFARAVSESLVSELSNLPGVQVLSPSTVHRHQQFGISMGLMGRLLGLDALVEGTVQSGNDRVRIASRLVDVHTGKVILAQNNDYPAGDLDLMEDLAAHDIAAQLAASLAKASPHDPAPSH